MSPASFLKGQVQKWSLPLIQGTPPADAPNLKRLDLPQGELAQFYSGEQGIHYIAFAQLRPECVRGNHYHRIKEEFVYIISGQVLLVVQEVDSGARESIDLQTGDLMFIGTGIAHAFRSSQAGQAIEFSTAPFNAADVERFPLL